MLQIILLIIIGIFGGYALNKMTKPPVKNNTKS